MRNISIVHSIYVLSGLEVQSVVSLIVDPEAMSLILACSHTFVEFDDEIFSTIILLLPLNHEGLCQLQAKVCARSTG